MQKQVFFHQYRRPRYNNPTFISNNVNSSLTFFNGSYQQPHLQQQLQQPQHLKHLQQNKQLQSNIQSYSNYKNQSVIDNYQPQNKHYSNPIGFNDSTYRSPSINFNTVRQRSSNLSAYGSTSLSLNQKDIYNKQNSNFNIITMKPKQYDTSIKQHPTLTVQNKDQMYYKRMTQQFKKKTQYNLNDNQNKNNINNIRQKQRQRQNTIDKKQSSTNNNNTIAGKYTYGIDKNINKFDRNTFNIDRNTNNIDKNNKPLFYQQQYTNNQINDTLPITKPNKHFTPKLLNHMDQLITLS